MSIVSQNVVKHVFFARQHRIGGKTYEVLTTFYAKQTQLLKSQMNVTPYNTTDYENKSNWTLGQNKPNSNPIKPNFQKAKMNANAFSQKDYENETALRPQKNKPKQTLS